MMDLKLQCVFVLNFLFYQSKVQSQCTGTRGCFPRDEEFFGQGIKFPLRTVTVSSTCSDGQVFRTLQLNDEKNYTCSAAERQSSFMLDKVTKTITVPVPLTTREPNYLTYWQSTIPPSSTEDIVLNLTNIFLINKISITFVAPKGDPNVISDGRPKVLAVEKFDDKLKSWSGLVYVAENCGDFSQVPLLPKIGPNYNASTPYCKEAQFGGDKSSQFLSDMVDGTRDIPGNVQKVEFNPSLDHSNEFYTLPSVQRHYMTSAVRVRLVRPTLSEPLRAYFAIADISVYGTCACFGHSANCTGQNADKCGCEHKTDGINCEKCLPLYNNRTWMMGTQDVANECQACDCNKHAASCHFDDIKGYGVCDNCENNTLGDHCNDCKPGYHVNPASLPGSTVLPPAGNCSGHNGVQDVEYECNSYCIPCDCSGSGTDPSEKFVCNSQTGQCLCKTNVMGTRCVECKDTYWGIMAALTAGCKTCNCDSIGSFNSTNFCNKTTGVCVCKTNVEGLACNKCKPGSYKLELGNIKDGCTLCECDLGGAVNAVCDDVTGQCTCRPNIQGRDCRQTIAKTYVPKLDHFTFDVEFQNSEKLKEEEVPGHGRLDSTVTGRGLVELLPGKTMTVTLEVPPPLTRLFDVVVRYRLNDSSSTLQGEISQISGVDYECAGKQYTVQQMWQRDVAITGPTDRGSVLMHTVCMKESQKYKLKLTTTSTCFIDSIVLLPQIENLSAFKMADTATQSNMTNCRDASKSVNLALRESLRCSLLEYSLMAEFFGGAIPCTCNVDGTKANTACEPLGGQCQCIDNIILRHCDICKVDSYGLNIQEGCTACNCNLNGSVKAFCNESGFCECRQNVIGMKCDSCLQDYHGLSTGKGCVKCQCNADYAVNNLCTDDGQCPCKPGVGGHLCTQCLDGFFNLTSAGCSPCNCHVDGSTSAVCNKQSGECTCKLATTGAKCAQCKTGYFGIGPWSIDGCMKCFCSGLGNGCYSAPGWFKSNTTSLWTLHSTAAVDDRWAGEDDSGADVPITEAIVLTVIPPQYVMRITNVGLNVQRAHCYFVAPSKFLGNKQSSYGLKLTITLRSSTNSTVITERSNGDVILKGKDTDFVLVKQLPHLTGKTPLDYIFVMREDQWFVNSTSGKGATYEDLMKTLSNLESIKIRGKYSNDTNAYTDLFRVILEHANQTGTQSINNVEQCACPQQLTGPHCELCASGYKRQTVTGGQFDVCVKCECNGHAGGPCNVQTGVCQCTHFTTGDKCDQCLPGYYGNALGGKPGDCQPCMCPGNVVGADVNVFAKTCESPTAGQTGPVCHNCSVGHRGNQCEVCQANYYGVPTDPKNNGGKCVPCVCNGRADTCNSTTGVCADCKQNTTGKECEICAAYFFGDAMRGVCKPCSCKASVGSTGECDSTTGRCTCRPNVIGFNCDRCVELAFNHSSGSGCTMCDCHIHGAFGSQCDLLTGQCSCRSHVTGRQCNVCAATYWKLNSLTGCDACNCDPRGTADTKPFGTCDIITGQCKCLSEAIVGRKCDECSRISKKSYSFVKIFTIGEYPDCTHCGECFDNWAGKIEALYNELVKLDGQTKTIWTHYNNQDAAAVQLVLKEIQTNIANAEKSIVKATNISSALDLLQADLRKVLDKASAIDKDLVVLQQDHDLSDNNLKNISQFTGEIHTDSGTIISESQLTDKVKSITNQIEAWYKMGNTSWTKIKSLSFLVGSSDESIKLLKNRVNTAMLVLSMAMKTYNSAKTIYEGTFLDGFKGNENILATGEAASAKATEELNRIKTTLMEISARYAQAKTIMASIMQLANEKKTALAEALIKSQTAKLNADIAMKAAQDAEAALTIFKTEADKAKSDLTVAFKKVSESAESLQEIVKQMMNVTTLVNSILNLELRPLTDIQTIATKIQGTQISSSDVAATNQKAQQALETAQKSLNDTQKAMDDSRKALEQVQGIQDNLKEAETLRSETLQLKVASDAYNMSVINAVTKMNAKVKEANTLSQSTSEAITSVLAVTSNVTKCFTDRDAAATTAVNTATSSLNEAQVIAQNHNKAGSTVSLLNEEISKKDFGSSFTSIDSTNVKLTGFNNEFGTVESVADLTAMLQEYKLQRDELIILQNELGTQESQLDSLMQSLQLNSPTSACATN